MGQILSNHARCAIGAASPVDLPLSFLTNTVRKVGQVVMPRGIRGTVMDDQVELMRNGKSRIEGTITAEPTSGEWASWLPFILGTAVSGTTYAMAEDLLARYHVIDNTDDLRTDGKSFEHAGCYVSRATFTGRPGEPIMLQVDIVGKTETINAASALSGTAAFLTLGTQKPFIFEDGVLTIGGSTYSTPEWTVTVENNLVVRHWNSLTPTSIRAGKKKVTFSLRIPYGDAETIYSASTGASGVAADVTATNADEATSLKFDFIKVVFPPLGPNPGGKDEETLIELQGTACKSSTTKPLIVTLDSTP